MNFNRPGQVPSIAASAARCAGSLAHTVRHRPWGSRVMALSRSLSLLLFVPLLLGPASLARAEVKLAAADALLIEHHYRLAAPPARAWQALAHPERWWPQEHTWSGQRGNLSLRMALGGCFCERWKDGGAEHGRVVMLRRGELLRLQAALGPFQELAVSGVLGIALAAREGGTDVTVSYRVSGTSEHALDRMAPMVDQVLDQQFGGFAHYADGVVP